MVVVQRRQAVIMGVFAVQTTLFGSTGTSVSRLGFGSMGLRGPRTWGVRCVDEVQSERVLQAVLDAGINLLDTAPDYGLAEERIGRYLRHRRSQFLLATKCGCDPLQHADHLEVRHTWTAAVVRGNLEASLRRLQTDCIDILQFHGGDADTLQQAGLIDLLQSFRQQGKIRWLGISSALPHLPALLQLQVFDTVQVPWSCLAPQHADCIADAAARGCGLIIRGGIAQGGPDAEIQRPQWNDIWQQAKLDELLPPDTTRAQFILRCTLSNPQHHSVIVGTASLEHLAENVAAAAAGPLPREILQQVTQRVAAVLAQPVPNP